VGGRLCTTLSHVETISIAIVVAIFLYNDRFVPIVPVAILLDDYRLMIAVSIPVAVSVRTDCYANGPDSDANLFCSCGHRAATNNRSDGDYQCKPHHRMSPLN
jgi:hypothetical protein